MSCDETWGHAVWAEFVTLVHETELYVLAQRCRIQEKQWLGDFHVWRGAMGYVDSIWYSIQSLYILYYTCNITDVRGYVFCDCNGYLKLCISCFYRCVWTWSTRSTTWSPLISPLSLALLFVLSDMFKTYPKHFGRIVADQMSWPTDQPLTLQNMLSVECVRFCIKGCRVSMIVRIMLVLLLHDPQLL